MNGFILFGDSMSKSVWLTVSSWNPSYYDVLAWKPCVVIEEQSCVDLVPHVSFEVLFEYQKVTRHLCCT